MAIYNYYNPRAGYGGQAYGYKPGEFATTPVGDKYLEDNREAAFTRFLADRGIQQGTARGDFYGGQLRNLERGYEAALGTAPNLKWQSFLQQNAGQLGDQFGRLTPQQRNANPSLVAPRARNIPW